MFNAVTKLVNRKTQIFVEHTAKLPCVSCLHSQLTKLRIFADIDFLLLDAANKVSPNRMIDGMKHFKFHFLRRGNDDVFNLHTQQTAYEILNYTSLLGDAIFGTRKNLRFYRVICLMIWKEK